MAIVLTTFLIRELTEVTKNYLNFKTSIIIDLNENMIEQNYPFITFRVTSPELRNNIYPILANVERYLNGVPERIDQSCLNNYFNLPRDQISDNIWYYYCITECCNYNPLVLTDKRLAQRFLRSTNISLFSGENMHARLGIEIITTVWLRYELFVVIKAKNDRKLRQSNKRRMFHLVLWLPFRIDPFNQ